MKSQTQPIRLWMRFHIGIQSHALIESILSTPPQNVEKEAIETDGFLLIFTGKCTSARTAQPKYTSGV